MKYRLIFSDEDQAFLSKSANTFYKKHKLTRYSVKSRKYKNSLVERFIRTLRSYLFRYFTHNNTFNFRNILQKIQNKYNSTPHRGLCGKTPSEIHQLTDPVEIRKAESCQMKQKLHNYNSSIIKREQNILNSLSSRLTVGTHVRILLNSAERLLAKTSSEKIFSDEIFKVAKVDVRLPVTYYLEDLKGNKIIGVVYRKELSPVNLPNTYFVEKIISTKKDPKTGKTKYLVKWLGYQDSENSWVDSIMRL